MTGCKDDYLPFSFTGLTPSGDAMSTTLGNTLRSIFYMHFYCRHIREIDFFSGRGACLFAAGDDVVVFCEPHLA